jgi:hypothetical protein
MDRDKRRAFNGAYDEALFQRFLKSLEGVVGALPFRVAETPLFLTKDLVTRLARSASEIVAELSHPDALEAMKRVVPVHYDVQGMDKLPHCVQVDFALCPGKDGELEGKVVELQGFPSLYALETLMADVWSDILQTVPGLDIPWTCFVDCTRDAAVDLMRRTIVSDFDPEHVVLVDLEPEKQKTYPDFVATKILFDVDSVCVTKLIKEGKRLYRLKDGRRVPVKRIYNRMVFDELETRNVKPPFLWNEDLDVTWCAHPNWYWTWSKYSLPFLRHPAVPRARFLSDVKVEELPEDLSGYVLKPLFSFAGAGVVVDVTHEAIAGVPQDQRDRWVLQEKIEYAPAITMPTGEGVKAEVRVMLMRPAHEWRLVPLIYLVRLSRGKMLGVDYNKNLTWVGGSVGLWPR